MHQISVDYLKFVATDSVCLDAAATGIVGKGAAGGVSFCKIPALVCHELSKLNDSACSSCNSLALSAALGCNVAHQCGIHALLHSSILLEVARLDANLLLVLAVAALAEPTRQQAFPRRSKSFAPPCLRGGSITWAPCPKGITAAKGER